MYTLINVDILVISYDPHEVIQLLVHFITFIFSHNIYEHVLDNVNDLKRTMMKNTVTVLKNYQYSWDPINSGLKRGMRYHLKTVRMAAIKETRNSKC